MSHIFAKDNIFVYITQIQNKKELKLDGADNIVP